MSVTPASPLGKGLLPPEGLFAGVEPVEGGASTGFPEATDAALEMLRAGGNAIDAAVAAAWALSVCEPSGSGLGGQSALLVFRADGTARVIDGHSYAPAAVSTTTVSLLQQRVGHRASTIPSTPATLGYAQRQYGVLTLSQALEPAIRIAENGYAITPLQHRQTRCVAGALQASSAASSLFLTNGQPPPIGHIFRQPQLAGTLRRIADRGVEGFYRGSMARAIAEDMRRNGGLLTEKDLETCTLPVERDPLRVAYRGFQAVSVPPPGGGLQLLLALKIFEQLLPSVGPADPDEWYESIAMALYASFREREKTPLGPGDLTPSLHASMFSEERLREVATEIRGARLPGTQAVVGEGPGDTTHVTVADRAGNVVALTQSIQSLFGAKVANPELGFVYNNYLSSCPREPHLYGLAGNCLPQSNAAPTLVLRNTTGGLAPLLALGAAGSRRITSAILQVISSVLDRGLAADQAVAAPRVHALLSRRVWIEAPAASPKLVENLLKHFVKVRLLPPLSYKMGSVQALGWSSSGTLRGAADPRRDGAAATFP